MNIRVGNGIDTHPLVKGESLILGGIDIPSEIGTKGHSDGDALIHSIIDSLLGAISKKDIGHYFPSSNSKLKNISSCVLLKDIVEIIKEEGYRVLNIDSTIILEFPHLSAHIDSIIKNIAKEMNLDINKISVKATTNDGLGFIGEGRGISVITTSLIIKE